MLLPLLMLSVRNTSGYVGDVIRPYEDLIHTIQIDLDDLALIHSEAYSGSLRFTSLGAVDDPVYGSMKSTALLKPSLSSSTEIGRASCRERGWMEGGEGAVEGCEVGRRKRE